MRIAIDIQGLQSESRFRGIGRYTRSIIKSILTLARGKNHDVILIGNGAFPSIGLINEFSPLIGRSNIKFWHPAGPCSYEQTDNHHNNKNAKIIREAFFKSHRPDVIYIPTMFEGYQDNSVLSVNEFDTKTPVVTTLYDLIPLHNPEEYLDSNPNYKKFYLEKISYLKSCKKLLSISDFSRNEGCEYFMGRESDIVNMSTACDDIFQLLDLSQDEKGDFLNKLNINKPFIMYSGGADERKNLPALIKALSELPIELRKKYDFVIAGKLSQFDIDSLKHHANKNNLEYMELIITGYISDEALVKLYNCCSLFVFPSWHEGFGLPALEALACGAVVVGAGNTSLPEVIGMEEALFDPYSVSDMTSKIKNVLTNEQLYNDMRERGLQRAQAFSWERSAVIALTILEQVAEESSLVKKIESNEKEKRKLAFFTPLTPARSGIALYSEELLPALTKFYDIDVVIDKSHSAIKIDSDYKIIDVEQFIAKSDSYERIVYQMGNSVFHDYMHEIMEVYPGVVCMHDFYLSNYFRHKESHAGFEKIWSEQLLLSHGYCSLIQRAELKNDESIMYQFPSNFNTLTNALAVIVHSDYSIKLANQWYGNSGSIDWERVPLLRNAPKSIDKTLARNQLGIDEDSILICSFGLLDHSKLNHHIVEAVGILQSTNKTKIKLTFVGEIGGEYKNVIETLIKRYNIQSIVEITGWASDELYVKYLCAADIAIQLRSLSRGETSAAVLDCMNYGLATIVNANGSMAELPDDFVVKLVDDFDINDLAGAIQKLCIDASFRQTLGRGSQNYISEVHCPEICAESYFNHIESAYKKSNVLINDVIDKLDISHDDINIYAGLLSGNFPRLKSTRRILFDVSLIMKSELWTGIERVTRALLIELIKLSNNDLSVIPVFLSKEQSGYVLREANSFIAKLYPEVSSYLETERCVDLNANDVYFSSELACDLVIDAEKNGFYEHLLKSNVQLSFMIHDILPVTRNEFFPPGSNLNFTEWLNIVLRYADKVIFDTNAVREEVKDYIIKNELSNERLILDYSHLGADISSVKPSGGINKQEKDLIYKVRENRSFLMVGTIEPRKGHFQSITAFDILWAKGNNSNLVIVGKEGWKGLDNNSRRTIPDIVRMIKSHPLLNKKLFWFDNASDEVLEELYQNADCLLYPSEAEGFGLPLIEASQHNKPLISRDIPVLREVAGNGAYYFKTTEPEALALAVEEWIELFSNSAQPDSGIIDWLSWSQSAKNLVAKLFD